MKGQKIIIVGGGLWGGLLAYRWQGLYPQDDLVLWEKDASFGGNHTWSFHETDLSQESLDWIRPFIEKRWDAYEVQFPRYRRTFKSGYCTISSERFDRVLKESLRPGTYHLGKMMDLKQHFPEDTWIIDATGIYEAKIKGYQKFLGLELKLDGGHGLFHPVLMDATVPQLDGFRFLYYLPFTNDRVLVEDTRYSSHGALNKNEYRKEILEIVENKGWKISSVLREETGVLPLPMGPIEVRSGKGIVSLSGLFHDTTGYSLPDAMRFINEALSRPVTYESFSEDLYSYRRSRRSDRSFFRLLNRFMFRASSEEERYKMLEFFYGKSPELISRFYSGELRSHERIKFFIGIPPISPWKAMWEILK